VNEEAESKFNPDGTLNQNVIDQSRQIVDPPVGNTAVPPEFGKYRTPTFRTPSGTGNAHFYYDPVTARALYGIDYKVYFNYTKIEINR
jgi:hypothetical protein